MQSRLKYETRDFFQLDLDTTTNIIILKAILYDQPDKEAITILSSVTKHIKPDDRLQIFKSIIDRVESSYLKLKLASNTAIVFAISRGRERNEA